MSEIVLSYHNSLLRQSDFKLLLTREWINDNLIEFWLEYLYNELFKNYQDKLLCIGPSMSHLIKLTNDHQDVQAFLQPLEIDCKELVLIPINDNSYSESAGGSHWSLLVLYVASRKFEHYDSSINSNNVYHAKKIASKLNKLLHGNINLDLVIMTCNQQEDSYNCGIHVICNAKAVCTKYFRNDTRHVSDVANIEIIKGFRRTLIDLIESLRE